MSTTPDGVRTGDGIWLLPDDRHISRQNLWGWRLVFVIVFLLQVPGALANGGPFYALGMAGALFLVYYGGLRWFSDTDG